MSAVVFDDNATTMKITLAGAPRSGKSCLRQGLKDIIRLRSDMPYPYVITACPDGEGSWFQETMSANPEVASACKAAYKSKFSDAFVNRIVESIRNCSLELCLVDIGGIMSPENERICSAADAAIFVHGDSTSLELADEWYKFLDRCGCAVIADIYSDYNGSQDSVTGVVDGVFHASVHHLERGEDLTRRTALHALVQYLAAVIRR